LPWPTSKQPKPALQPACVDTSQSWPQNVGPLGAHWLLLGQPQPALTLHGMTHTPPDAAVFVSLMHTAPAPQSALLLHGPPTVPFAFAMHVC